MMYNSESYMTHDYIYPVLPPHIDLGGLVIMKSYTQYYICDFYNLKLIKVIPRHPNVDKLIGLIRDVDYGLESQLHISEGHIQTMVDRLKNFIDDFVNSREDKLDGSIATES